MPQTSGLRVVLPHVSLMPPRDPRLCPALERALPCDAAPGSSRVPERPEPLEVLFGDGAWHLVSVRAWRRDRYGRDVVQVEWHIGGETFGES